MNHSSDESVEKLLVIGQWSIEKSRLRLRIGHLSLVSGQ